MLPPQRLIVAISGASGSRYAALLLQQVVPRVPQVAVVYSRVAPRVITHELDLPAGRGTDPLALLDDIVVPAGHRVQRYGLNDYSAPFASGSNAYDAMVIIPCSQGLIGRIAAGLAETLIERAADVCLKERRPLLLVPRETPLSQIHLRNWLSLTEAGAIILPACPSFYHRPQTVDAVLLSVVDRVLAHLDLPRPEAYQWTGEGET
ncbi:MAG: UbiX family flavin prenyltransferase [Fimbriimonadaceae bacterium]|nr:UbiX family flavin prenyltransferase [Fimbriimonadaceae bacterium]